MMQYARSLVIWIVLLLATFQPLAVQQLHADQSVTVAWDANPEPDVCAYIVYYGTNSRSYHWSTNVGNVTTATVYGLAEGLTWYFAITARNTSGLESDYSNEVTNAIPSNVTNHVPRIDSLSDLVALEDRPTSRLFTVGDDETPAASLVVSATSTNIALVSNTNLVITLGPTANDRWLFIRPSKDQSGITLVTVVVSDGAKASSTSFLLTILNVPEPPVVFLPGG